MKGFLKALAWIVGIIAILLVIGRYTVYEPGEAPDNAMAPNLWKGDKILTWHLGKVEQGDVVYCQHPVLQGQMVVGRVAGLPGDTVEITRGQLLINGDTIFEESDKPLTYWDTQSSTEMIKTEFDRRTEIVGGRLITIMYLKKGGALKDMKKTKVQNGYFLLGDNRNQAIGAVDSRTYGEVHSSLCKGKVFFIYKAVKGIGDPDNEGRMLGMLF